MYIVLANEVANIDLSEFEKVGICGKEVIAVPSIDVSLNLKGMRSSLFDKVEDCQNTLFLSYKAPCDESDLETELLEDPFLPGIIYRRAERDYVELMYVQHIGALMLHVYFLIDVDDCTFGLQEEHGVDMDVDYEFLRTEGLIRQVP